jgi:drug/metabolite transporter (DMT)-like permease
MGFGAGGAKRQVAAMQRWAERPLVADLVLLSLTSIWGATFLFVKDALVDSDPMSFMGARFGLGVAVALPFAWRALRDPALLLAGVVLGVLLFIGFSTQTLGLNFTTPSRSAFITGLSVLLVPFASIALFRRLPSPPSYLGIGLAVAGLAWLTGVTLPEPAPRAQTIGDLLTVVCAVAFSLHIALTERYAARHPALGLVTVQLALGALLSVTCLPFASPHWHTSRALVAAVLFCGLAAGVGALVLQAWAQARTTAVRAALIFALEPVWAAVYSVWLGRERLGPRELLGGGLIVLGIVVAEVGGALWRSRQAQPSQA